MLAALALMCGQAQAQNFLSKLKEKASEAIGNVAGFGGIGGIGGIGGDESAAESMVPNDDPNSVQAVSGERALPARRASTFGWDGPVTPSEAKFPIPLMNEFPKVPSAASLVNPVESEQIAYYKAIKAVTLRAEELNADTTCEDTETKMWREKANQGLKDAFGLTDEEIAMLNRDDLSEADQKRLEDKISKAVLGDMDPSALEKDAAKYENMSEKDIEKMMTEKTLKTNFAIYDRHAAEIKKYMGVSTQELKDAAREQVESGETSKASPKNVALQNKVKAFQKAEAAKDPKFKKEADAFEKKMQGEMRDAAMKQSREMMGGMGNMMDIMQNTQAKMAPFMEMEQKLYKYTQDVQECLLGGDPTKIAMQQDADAAFSAAERKKVLAIKKKIYETKDASVYNPLYLEALNLIMSYRERAAKAWAADVQKRFDALKGNLSKLIKINRQAIADGLIPECALWRAPLNMVISAGDVLADAYSEFPSDYPKMYKEEVVRTIPLSSVPGYKPGGKGAYDHEVDVWWPEFVVSKDYESVVSGRCAYAAGGGWIFQWNGASWDKLSDEKIKALNDQKKTAPVPAQSWTSSDGKRTVYYNAEGGFLQMPEGDQVFPDAFQRNGNELNWVHMATEDTGDGNFNLLIVKCTYKL